MEKDLTEANGIDLLDEFEKLIQEQARKPKTFDKIKYKKERLNIVYEEVFRRMFNYVN